MTYLTLKILATSLVLTAIGVVAPAVAADEARETIVPAFEHPIANAPGKKMTALIVSYAPGAKTPAHRHGQSFVVGYVLEGSIRSRVDDGEVRVYKAGESWTEMPGARHQVSENASTTEPARLLAVFVSDTKAKDLFTHDGAHGKTK